MNSSPSSTPPECRKPVSQRIAVDHIVNHVPRVCHLPKGHGGPCSPRRASRPEFVLRNDETDKVYPLGPMYSGSDDYVIRKVRAENLSYPWTLLKAVAVRDGDAASVPVEFAIRNIVGRWLRLRGEHIEGSFGLSEFIVPRDRQAQLFQQLSADADHSDLLLRLLKGEEPLPFDEWKERHAR